MSASLPHRGLTAAAALFVALTGLPVAEAASTGYGAAGNVPLAGACWGGSFTLANVNTSDNAWASCAGATNYGHLSTFGFVVPPTATITGIEVEVEGNDGTGATVTYTVELSWNNGTGWTALQSSTFTGTADATTVLGGPADNWGRAWTVAELSDANFRLRIRRTAGGTLRIDRIRVNVHFTLASATTPLYRSVGTSTADLNTPPARTVQIAGTTATFSDSMPANVGVGDVLQYQVAAVYYLAFISGRTSDMVYTVQSSTGGTPQAAAAFTAVSVFRAYTRLFDWEAQNENTSINIAVRNFDTSPALDLVTPNRVMNVACYGDVNPDTTAVTVSGWTTAATNYIRIYTPTSLTEVGTSQRHPGRWDTTKYQLEAAGSVLWIEAYYVRVEGLQIRLTADVANVGGIVFSRSGDAGVSEYEVSSSIVRGNGAGGSDIRIGINPYFAGSGVLRIWNNVIYDWRGGSNWVAGIVPDDPDYTVYVYNNTIVDCEYGIDVSEGTVIAKNNLVYGSALDNYYGAYSASSTNNLSGPTQTDAPGSNPRNLAIVTFVNAAGDDFHLAASDTGARDQGADLSADALLPFTVDVDGGTRQAPWDIGADEQGAVALTCSVAARKPWYDAAWSYRKAILVDHTKVVGDLVDFPVLISRSGDTDLAANARPDGFDILFTDDDGTTKLSHQREAYDGAGNLVAWVRVPLLPTGADKLIFLYYGNPSSADQQSVNATWSNGYQAVWHLSEASGTGAYILNSALNDYNGDPTGTAFNASGKIDGARTFSNVGTSNIDPANSGALFNGWGQFAFEFWIYPNYATDATWEGAGEDGFWYGNIGPVRLGRVRRFNWNPPGTGELQIDVEFNTAGTQYVADSINRSAWNHVVHTYSGSDYRVFFNGVEVYSDVFPGDSLIAAAYYTLLGHDTPDSALNGSLDEVRISNAGRSAEWIQTEYANQSSPATFCSACGAQNVGTTAVRLASFAARGFESSVLVEWETASELDNLGFHLYRGLSGDGPWARLNASLIPGLGSSPEGKCYRYVDGGLVNGTTYFYRLEDVDRRGGVTSHGPVSAVPVPGLAEPGEGESPTEPSPLPRTTPKATPERKAHGEPTRQSLRVLERTASGVTLELVTGGFYTEEQEGGTSRLIVPGFFDHSEPGFPTVPTRRLWTDAVVGRGVSLVSVEPSDLVVFPGLSVSLAGRPVAVAASDGTYRASSIPVRPGARSARDAAVTRSGQPATSATTDGPGLFPSPQAFVHQTAFQGVQKKAYVELAPLQIDEASGDVTLARRLVVRLAFAGSVAGETGRGNVGRCNPVTADASGTQVLAHLATRSRGLHSVAYEQIPGLTSPVVPSALRLSRLGSPVAFHLEPHRRPFGPGSVLSFLADDSDSAYGNEAVYELSIAPGGIQMGGVLPTRRTGPATSLAFLRHNRSFEKDAVYLPALLEARDLWMWDLGLPGGGNASYSFTLDSPVLVPQTARLSIELQGGSDTEADPDHHALAFLNGSLVGDVRFDGMVPATLAVDVPASLLLVGENSLRLENAGDTGSTASHVYLDRFSLEVPRAISSLAGALEGRADQAGRLTLAAAPGSLLFDVTSAVPRFLGRALADSRLAWNAEKDHRYLAVSPEAFLAPEVRSAPTAALRSVANQADWIVVAPQALLPVAETLRAHRESQGLAAIAVSLEDVVDEFGYGEAGPHALQRFLASAFHDWQAPAPRYVLLLGDASYDPKGHLAGASRPDLIPSPLSKSTFLWTPADPLYAAVNGSDSLPDIAIGRINAASLTEAQTAVQKIFDFETSGQTLTGKATLVADNPDLAGDFQANQDEIATLLPSRSVEKLYLTQLGTDATKAAVRNAFDSGLSLMSYVGHGSSGLWASEGILRSPDVASFAPQPAQPLVLAMTCSNGYFLSPYNNSLAERLVLADSRGAIAAFAPSGLSLNDAAHVYHGAVVAELEGGPHTRLGDLLLAAQATYAASGAFPELLDFYNLLGDPGTRIR